MNNRVYKISIMNSTKLPPSEAVESQIQQSSSSYGVNNEIKTELIQSVDNLQGFSSIFRSYINEYMTFVSNLIFQKISESYFENGVGGDRNEYMFQVIQYDENKPFALRSEYIVCHCLQYKLNEVINGVIMITGRNFSEKLSKRLMLSILNHMDFSNLIANSQLNNNYLQEIIKNPIDKIGKVDAQMDETLETVNNSLLQMLNQNESIEELVQKSQILSENSKKFYYETKKMNRCCSIS